MTPHYEEDTPHEALDRRYYDEGSLRLNDQKPDPTSYLRATLDGVTYRFVFLPLLSVGYVARETETGIEWQYRILLDPVLVSDGQLQIVPASMAEFAQANMAAIQAAHTRGETQRVVGNVYLPNPKSAPIEA
jgi:hypothetical protein